MNIKQSSGADLINRALQQLEQIIQKNASMAEEMSSTAEHIHSQAMHLQNVIAIFNVNTDI